ncbi:unnamed protein product, partial [Notodromas monacha]
MWFGQNQLAGNSWAKRDICPSSHEDDGTRICPAETQQELVDFSSAVGKMSEDFSHMKYEIGKGMESRRKRVRRQDQVFSGNLKLDVPMKILLDALRMHGFHPKTRKQQDYLLPMENRDLKSKKHQPKIFILTGLQRNNHSQEQNDPIQTLRPLATEFKIDTNKEHQTNENEGSHTTTAVPQDAKTEMHTEPSLSGIMQAWCEYSIS